MTDPGFPVGGAKLIFRQSSRKRTNRENLVGGGGRHLDLPLQWIKPLWRHSLDGGTSLYFWQNFLEKISNLKEICLLDPSLDQDVSTAKNWKHMTLKRFRNMNMFRFQSHWFVSSTCANLKQNLGARGCDVLPSMTCYYWTWEKELLAETSPVNVLFYSSSARSIKDVTCNVSFTCSTEILNWNYRRGFPKFFWLKLIELIWKTMNGSLEWKFLLPILFLLYVVLL